jgi:pSer/pThr/pTyr-binding forkhead associated (FHA) protein
VPELILSLRERVLLRHAIVAVRTTIGRDPSCDLVIDNAGISRLHATIEAVGDSFVLRDCESQNGVMLNGEPCQEGRLVHGDMVGINKFVLRFSNQALEVPVNLQTEGDKPKAARPKEVQRTLHLDAEAAQALAEVAKQQVARQRAERAARNGESLPDIPLPERPRPQPETMEWEEPESAGTSVAMFVGALVVGGAVVAALMMIVF